MYARVSTEAREGSDSPGAEITGNGPLPGVGAGNSSGPLEEQPPLALQLLAQPLFLFSFLFKGRVSF